MKHLYTRAFALLLFACAAPAALAPAALAQAPSPYIDKDGATTYEEADLRPDSAPEATPIRTVVVPSPEAPQRSMEDLEAAVAAGEITEAEAIAELEKALEGMASAMGEAMGEALGLSPEQMAAAEVTTTDGASGGARKNDGLDFYRRNAVAPPVQVHPIIPDGYGRDGDGFPDRMAVSGTIVSAGSLRICRWDAPPVSRWLRIRLSNTTATYPGQEIVVAVQCHEDKKELLVGRRVRMEVWKSLMGRPIRMATDDVPSVGTPMYESYPGNVRLGG